MEALGGKVSTVHKQVFVISDLDRTTWPLEPFVLLFKVCNVIHGLQESPQVNLVWLKSSSMCLVCDRRHADG